MPVRLVVFVPEHHAHLHLSLVQRSHDRLKLLLSLVIRVVDVVIVETGGQQTLGALSVVIHRRWQAGGSAFRAQIVVIVGAIGHRAIHGERL